MLKMKWNEHQKKKYVAFFWGFIFACLYDCSEKSIVFIPIFVIFIFRFISLLLFEIINTRKKSIFFLN